MKKLLAVLSLSFVSSMAFADPDGVRLGTPSYGGTGCPGGSASAVLAPDGQSVSFLFDSFVVQAGGASGQSLDRKACNLAIPVHVPQGRSASVFQIDYRGFNALPFGAYSRFNVEYFFAGSRGPAYSKMFYGVINEDYLLSNTLDANAVVWSECGKDVILRVNANMMVQTNIAREQAMSTVDSADIKSGLVYHFQWRDCN